MAIIEGDDRNNNLTGRANEADEIKGFGGDDTLAGLAGDDTLWGGAGHDTLFGNAGNDSLIGGQGRDVLHGGSGNDILNGGAGNDYLKSYNLFRLSGGVEYDEVTGGGGADIFDLTDINGDVGYIGDDILAPNTPSTPNASKGFALIKDFNTADGDTIWLDGFAPHYRLEAVSGGQDFGQANTDSTIDVAIVYTGINDDQNDVVGVLQDVSSQFASNPAAYLNNPSVFQFLG